MSAFHQPQKQRIGAQAIEAAMQSIAEWLEELGLGEYAQRFAENGIDSSVLGHLSDQDLKDLGVLLGHRRKLQAAMPGFRALLLPRPRRQLRPQPSLRTPLNAVSSPCCSATLWARQSYQPDSIPRTCGRSSAPIAAAARSWSNGTAGSSPSIWAMASSPISATRRPMSTTPRVRSAPGLPWS